MNRVEQLIAQPYDGMAEDFTAAMREEHPAMQPGWDALAFALRKAGNILSAENVWQGNTLLRNLHPDGPGAVRMRKADPTPALQPAWLRGRRFSLHWLPKPHIESGVAEGLHTASCVPDPGDVTAFAGLLQFCLAMGYAPYLQGRDFHFVPEPPVWLSSLFIPGTRPVAIPFSGTPQAFAEMGEALRMRNLSLLVEEMRTQFRMACSILNDWRNIGIVVGRDVTVSEDGEVLVHGEGAAAEIAREDVFVWHDALSCQLRFGKKSSTFPP